MAERLKIAVVAPEHPNSPQRGGIARYLRDYLPALAGKADVTLVSVEDGEPLPGVPQIVIRRPLLLSPLRPPVLSRRITRALAKLRPDCVEYANFMGLGCRDNGDWPKVVRLSTPVQLGSLRPGLLPRWARPLHDHWEQCMMQRMTFAISNTHANLETCEKVYGQLPPITIVPHGLNWEVTQPDSNAHDVLYVGRFEARKGVDILLKAWEEIVEKELVPANVVLHLVGRDTPGPGGRSYMDDLLEQTKIPGERLQVHGNLSNQQLARLRKCCRISVIPSRYESFGMVALEAFAAGQMVIASDAGGLAEVVSHGRTGLLFPNHDRKAFMTHLIHAVKNPEYTKRLTTEARETLVDQFGVDAMVERSLTAYRNAIRQFHLKGK